MTVRDGSVAGEGGARPRLLLAALALAVLSQALLAAAFGNEPVSRRADWLVAGTVMVLLAGPSALLIAGVWRSRDLQAPASLMLAILVAGLAMRLPFLWAGPLMEDDHARYLLDGAMVAHGLAPYTHAPADLAAGPPGVPAELLQAGRETIATINFPDLRSIYPGGAQLVFALAHLLDPWGVAGLRIVMLAAEALGALLAWIALRRIGRPAVLVALVWCNPLLAFTLTGQAHVDAALAPAILAALLLVDRRAAVAAGMCLGFAAGVKLWPALLAPLLLRALWPDRAAAIRFTLALGATTLLLCGPLLLASLTARSGLVAYAGGWSINNAPYAWASYGTFLALGEGGERILRGLIVAAAILAALAVALPRVAGLSATVSRSAVLAAILFYLSPAQFPWYAAAFLTLAAPAGAWGLTAAAVGLPVYVLFFPLAEAGVRDVHGYGIAALHLVPVVAMAVYARMHGATREAG